MACPDAGVFSSFVSGALDGDTRARLELHVDTCESCRILLSETCRGAAPRTDGVRAMPAVGDQVDRYTIAGTLGSGAMGVVMLARDPELDRELAIKLVQPQAGSAEDELVQQRMQREGRALARIDHPNVVRVFDVGRWQGALFVAMERAPGRTLREWLAAGRSTAEIVDVFLQCAAGLAAAHDAGVVHRDFKPENVIVDDAGRARVTDFGLAITDAVPDDVRTVPTGPVTATALDAGDPRLTRTHGMVGTPAYMAPEQHRGGTVDARSDQFALCIALAEAVSGQRPFGGDDRLAAIEQGRAEISPSVPRWLRRVLVRGLAFDPAQRYPSLRELARALERPRPRWPWLVAAVALVGASASVYASRVHDDPCGGATASLDRVWRADRVQRVAFAFASSGRAFAAPAWDYTRDAVNRYANGWRTLRVEACRAHPAPVTTVRCLERHASELDALLARWEQGTIETLAAAPFAADALGSAESCKTAEIDPAPASPTERARVDELEKRFYAARADDLAGRAPAAAAAMTALIPDLERAGLHVLRAEALFTLAMAERELGKAKEAHDHLVAAIAVAETARVDRTKARAWTALAELADEVDMRPGEARDALRFAAAVSEQLGKPEELELERQVAVGLVALAAGEHEAAVAALRASLAGNTPLHVAEQTRRLQILARALIAAGQIEPAYTELKRAEQLISGALGPDSPHLIPVLNTQGEPLDYLGRRDEAIAGDERALRIFDASFGTDNPRRTYILNNLAVIYANRGDLARAIELSSEVLAAKIKAYGEQAYEVGIAHQNLASSLLDARDAPRALDHLDRALRIMTKSLGADHPLIANVESSLSSAHLLLGHPQEGLAHAQRALAIREAAEVGAGYLAYSRFEVAQALIVAGQRKAGIAMAKRALELPLAKDGREGELAATIRKLIDEASRR